MSELNITDAGLNIGVNVCITKRDFKTGRILQQVKEHNRCLNTQLLGLAKFINGDYNKTSPALEQDYYKWIPRYLAVGTNIPAGGSQPVGTTVKVTDTRLLNEISPRMQLPERNKIVKKAGQDYIQILIDAYLPREYYNGNIIQEAGLFADETGNNCLFRIVLPTPIDKTEDSVVEVSWTITIISLDSENQPTVIVDKTVLENAFLAAMDAIKLKYPDCTDLCNAIYDTTNNCGIYIYADRSTTQQAVDDIAQTINTLANDL